MSSYFETKLVIAKTLHAMLLKSDEQEWFSAYSIAKNSNLDVGVAYVNRVLALAAEEEEIFQVVEDEDGDNLYTLSHEGLNWLDEWDEDVNGNENDKFPASDRFVSRSDNLGLAAEADLLLQEITEKLQSDSNEIGDAFGDERVVAIEEISLLRKLTNQVRFRAAPVLAIAQRTLLWITEKAGAASVGELAKKVLNLFFSWLGS